MDCGIEYSTLNSGVLVTFFVRREKADLVVEIIMDLVMEVIILGEVDLVVEVTMERAEEEVTMEGAEVIIMEEVDLVVEAITVKKTMAEDPWWL